MEVKHGMPFEEYHRVEALSQSDLQLMKRSPRHYKYSRVRGEEEPTDAMLFGSAFHCLVLTPDDFNNLYVFEPKDIDRRTKVGKEAYADFVIANQGKTVLPARFQSQIFEMAETFITHPVVVALHNIQPEVSLFWKDPEYGIDCKGRLDIYQADNRTIADVKTTTDARAEAFARTVCVMGYHRQAAWYIDGARECGLPVHCYLLLAVEKEPPYGIGCYMLIDEVIELGRRENRALVQKFAECVKSEQWPGYPETIQPIGVPVWYSQQNAEANI